MLKQRVITAAIGLPILLYVLIYGPSPWVLGLFALCVLLSVFETSKMMFSSLGKAIANDDLSASWAFATPVYGLLVFWLASLTNSVHTLSLVICALLMLIPLGIFVRAKNIEGAIAQAVCLTFSVCYGCLPWVSMWKLFEMGPNARYMLLLFAIVMMSDTGAYFCGLKFGRTKLAPKLSPKKSWEGMVGGMFAAVIGAEMMNAVFNFSLFNSLHLVIVALVTAIAGVLGDLVESALKRYAGVKDSGKIVPGHGGFLDRADALMLAAPTLWFMLTYLPLFLKE